LRNLILNGRSVKDGDIDLDATAADIDSAPQGHTRAIARQPSATICPAPPPRRKAHITEAFYMLSAKRKYFLLSALVVLMSLGWAGCRGFFVHATQTGLTVAPSTLNLQVGGSSQLTATANFDDGSTKNVTGSSTWSSSDSQHVSVNSTGQVTGVANTSTAASISAVNNGFTGSASVTVGATTQTITISPSGPFTAGTTQQFTATQNGTDVTSSVNWSSDATTVVSFSTTSNGFATFGVPGTATITASSSTGTGSIQVTVQ
jgi:hypothetical protein